MFQLLNNSEAENKFLQNFGYTFFVPRLASRARGVTVSLLVYFVDTADQGELALPGPNGLAH